MGLAMQLKSLKASLQRLCSVKQACGCLIQSLLALVGWRPDTVRDGKKKQQETEG